MNISNLAILITLFGELKDITPDDVRYIALDLETEGLISVEMLGDLRRNREQLAAEYNQFVADYNDGFGEKYADKMLSIESIKAHWHTKRAVELAERLGAL